jgi:RNA polymerase sigma factor (sigma-70 family)
VLSENQLKYILTNLPSGDSKAWTLFLDEFHPLIQGTLRRIVSESHLEDSCQQVYLALMEKDFRLIRKFDRPSFPAFLTYIQRISRNIGLRIRSKHIKEDQNILEMENSHSEMEDPRYDIEIQFIYKLDQEDLKHYINKLDLIYRDVIMLRIDGYKAFEIAEMLQEPLNTILTRMNRGKEKLKNLMLVK